MEAIYNEERRHEIWERTQAQGRVQVALLAEAFGVAAETIRRDLAALESAGLVRRVHGGAIAVNRLRFEAPLEDRTQHMADEKARIALAARDELPHQGAIFIDAGSTTGRLIHHLDELDLTVVTNSIPIALELARRPRLSVMTLGGRVRHETLAEVDDWALRSIAELRVDVALVAANAVSLDRGLGTPDPSEAAIKRAVLNAADKRVLLVDHTKFEAESLLTYGRLRDVDVVITGRELQAKKVRAIEAAGIRVVLV